MSDKVVVLNDGEAQQIASPEEIYERPANPFVAEFVGKSTQFNGQVTHEDGRAVVHNDSKQITLPDADVSDDQSVALYVRPEDIDVSPDPTGAENEFLGGQRAGRMFAEVAPNIPSYRYTVDTPEVTKAINTHFSDMMDGKVSPTKAVEKAAKQVANRTGRDLA